MTFSPPMGAGAPQDPTAGAAPGGAPPGGDSMAGGDPTMQLIMQIAMMVLGHPPQNEQEMMQVMQVLAAVQGGDSGAAAIGAGQGARPEAMPSSNTALVKAVNGGY